MNLFFSVRIKLLLFDFLYFCPFFTIDTLHHINDIFWWFTIFITFIHWTWFKTVVLLRLITEARFRLTAWFVWMWFAWWPFSILLPRRNTFSFILPFFEDSFAWYKYSNFSFNYNEEFISLFSIVDHIFTLFMKYKLHMLTYKFVIFMSHLNLIH